MDLRAENGAIGIRDVNGRLDARTKNGPIAFRGSAGDVRLVAENGPIKVRLTSPTWSGKGLDASTQNGPVKLVVPQGLRSGVRVTGSEHSPMKWGDGLGRVYKGVMGSDGQGFTLGREPVVIRLSTVNGPIDVTTTGKGKGSTRI